MFNKPVVILPQYIRSPIVPPLWRRVTVLLLQLATAALYGFAAVLLPPGLLFILIVPIVLCFLVALWMMPDRGVFPLRAIHRSYGAFFMLMLMWPSYIAIVLPGLPWLTPTRLALFAVTTIFLYSVSTSSLLRQHLFAIANSSKLFWTAFWLWQASMVVSLPFSHTVGQSLKILINKQLELTEVFFIGCLVFSRYATPTRTIGWLLAAASFWALEGFVELHLGYPPWANHIPSFMRIDEATLNIVLGSQARTADGLYRVRGPFTLSLIFSEFLALCVPFILHWMLTGRSLVVKLTMIGLLPLILAGILITQSRLGLVGTIVGIVVYVPLWAFKQWRADRTSIMGPAIFIGAPLIALGLMGVVFSSHTLSQRILGGGAQAASNESRAEQRRLAIPKIARNPIGHGLGQSGNVLGFANQNGMVSVDNHYLTTLLDLGLMGTLGYYGMFVVAAVLGVRVYFSTVDREVELAGPLATMCIVFMVVKSVLSQENNHPLVMLLLGMLVTLFARERKILDLNRNFLS